MLWRGSQAVSDHRQLPTKLVGPSARGHDQRGFILVGALLSGIALIIALVLMWSLMDLRDRQRFDAATSGIRVGMSESDVVRKMAGRRHTRVYGEQELCEHERQRAREWHSRAERPLTAEAQVLIFVASERKAYVYLDADGLVESVLLARRGDGDRFQVLRTRREVGTSSGR